MNAYGRHLIPRLISSGEMITLSVVLKGVGEMRIMVAMLGMLVVTGSCMFGQQSTTDIYDPAANIHAAIDSSVKTAQAQNKNVLLMFGGNWCPWCHRLHALFQSDPKIRALLDQSFILVMVDIGETSDKPLNRDLLKKYLVEGFGYPALAVIDQEGKLLSAQSTGILEKGKGHDPEKVHSYLSSQAPTPK
jgi:thioredoxin-related protein